MGNEKRLLIATSTYDEQNQKEIVAIITFLIYDLFIDLFHVVSQYISPYILQQLMREIMQQLLMIMWIKPLIEF